MELAETLAALAEGVSTLPAEGTGLYVTHAELAVPLEVRAGIRDQQLVFFAQPPHSRWRSGFLPPTHISRLSIAAEAVSAS
jgi:hypothetical protein